MRAWALMAVVAAYRQRSSHPGTPICCHQALVVLSSFFDRPFFSSCSPPLRPISCLSHLLFPFSRLHSLSLSLSIPLSQKFDGYMAAVPSKHDLASFVRSIHAELSLAVPAGSIGSAAAATASSEAEAAAGGGGLGGGGVSSEADFSLLPILLKGIVQAARLFCTKVEAMQSVEEVCRHVLSSARNPLGVGVFLCACVGLCGLCLSR